MAYKTHSVFLLARILILLLFLIGMAYAITNSFYYLAIGAGILSLLSFLNLHKFLQRRFREIDDFFESVKYRDFSRRFVEELGPHDIRQLHKGFNEVNRVVREINARKEVQYLYLQKILEMVDIGIIAYNLDTGQVLWANDTIKNTLDMPSFKNVSFVARRKPALYADVFDSYHPKAGSVSITVNNETLKVLISDTLFHIEEETYKLIVLQNIDETLDKNESEAWKKLLSVMTHEIMNSIAPISSLADTINNQVELSIKQPETFPLEKEDLQAGIISIKKRSEGLMKFAKTYRSLSKVTQLNLEKIYVNELFENIHHLMLPLLKDKHININFKEQVTGLQVEIDSYLIEQVLINLILNATDACKDLAEPKITITAGKAINGSIHIVVADNGVGIPPEILETIFVPFYTTKKNGSGIGLSLCKQIMLLHKGKINVQSKEGIGTAVSIVF
ncbi:HAMP domain-containing histidine kinase [Salegentibacter sp. JZCK2]|uniref:sensor histidine kinase n=1 Tax=Salegentibacter tibetensis TaxID=2873600 RepID=UPI001CCFE37D|nr:HAMP domain-containing sensor histidine kinase [Salegentibacter tibetensis]MBZ9731135.1 HAMP domain-containing histidine kinase [Salegentibacter tibetensis]